MTKETKMVTLTTEQLRDMLTELSTALEELTYTLAEIEQALVKRQEKIEANKRGLVPVKNDKEYKS